jgi:hypothetical protein
MFNSDFSFFIEMGIHHILQLNALDHLLFILTISGMVLQKTWKHAMLVTGCFAVGHTAAMWIGLFMNLPNLWIEFLIAATIVISGLWSYWKGEEKQTGIIYFVATFIFGYIHGLGFVDAFEMMLPDRSQIVSGAIGFVLGLEMGQVLMLYLFLLVGFLLNRFSRFSTKYYVVASSVVSILGGIYMMVERWPV